MTINHYLLIYVLGALAMVPYVYWQRDRMRERNAAGGPLAMRISIAIVLLLWPLIVIPAMGQVFRALKGGKASG